MTEIAISEAGANDILITMCSGYESGTRCYPYVNVSNMTVLSSRPPLSIKAGVSNFLKFLH